MMKIGILTFHHAINAGAVIQAYAMQQTLENMGYDASVVDYRPYYIESAYRPIRSLTLSHPRGAFYELWSAPFRNARIKKYDNFRNTYLRTSDIQSLSTMDCVILGSDQIWNASICGGTLDPMFFNVLPGRQARYGVAYAASTMSVEKLTANDKKLFAEWLPRLSAIGVREAKLASFLKDTFGVKACEVLDPTLIAPKDVFLPFVSKERKMAPYLLFYEVWHNREVEATARRIAYNKGLNFIGLSGSDIRFPRTDIKQVYSPADFVNLIANAEHIVTSSFHGTALSIIFEKNFNVVCEEPHQAKRMIELLDKLDLSEYFSYKEEPYSLGPICYDKVAGILGPMISDSIKFLKNSIQ